MAGWYAALKNLKTPPDRTDKTDRTHHDTVSSVLSVPLESVSEKSKPAAGEVSSVLSVPHGGVSEKFSALPSAQTVARDIAESGDLAIARLRNDARIAVRQADPFRCLTCGRPDRDGDPLVPVLSARDRDHIWLHLGACHAAYRAHMAGRAAEMARADRSASGSSASTTAAARP